MKNTLIITFLFSLVLPSYVHTQPKNTKNQPNIIFILVDDMGYGDVGFNGSTYYETPTIDALAKKSLILDQAFMYPTCSPSRTAFFTGKQSFRTGIYTVPALEKGTNQENIFSRWTVERKHVIFPEHLAEAGYKSIHLGKWHIVGPYPNEELQEEFPLKEHLSYPKDGDFSWVKNHKTPKVQQYYPEGRGFIKNVGGTFSGDPALDKGGNKSITGGYNAPFPNPFINPKPNDEWLTDRLTDEAIDFVKEHKDEPFFVNLHYYKVHRPIRKRSEESFQHFMNKPGDSITGQGIGKHRELHATYATMVASLDDNINRLMTYLDNNGLRDNTIIIFTSDNGYNGNTSANRNLRGCKGEVYEGGIKVPAFINWPGKVTPRRSETPISVLDYYPTLLELAGVNDYNGVMDGNSLIPLFQKDDSALNDRPLFWQLNSQWKHGTCSVIRKEGYKLIQFLATGYVELYNLYTDPLESTNLIYEEPIVVEHLLAELEKWRSDNKVPLPPNAVVN